MLFDDGFGRYTSTQHRKNLTPQFNYFVNCQGKPYLDLENFGFILTDSDSRMPRKSKLDKNVDVDLKQVPNVDIASSCSSPCKSNISVHSVDVNNNMCDSNLGLSELELKFRRRELGSERALMEAQRKIGNGKFEYKCW